MPQEIELKVAEIDRQSAGRGIVRIDPDAMSKIEVSSGDIIEINGHKATGAIVMYGPPEDRRTGLIRMDGLVRQNTGSSLGEYVKVRKAETKPATKIILAPAEEGSRLRKRRSTKRDPNQQTRNKGRPNKHNGNNTPTNKRRRLPLLRTGKTILTRRNKTSSNPNKPSWNSPNNRNHKSRPFSRSSVISQSDTISNL